jgi:16S rRNA (cytosine1402-N4)-methyltransferase
MGSDAPRHIPVLARETLALVPENARVVVDGTLGLAGHAATILEARPAARLVGFDRDAEALGIATERLRPFGGRVALRHTDFRTGLAALEGRAASFILLDLGVSSLQLDDERRGFSFRLDGPLDMRMNQDEPETAASFLRTRSERELERVLREFGEEPHAARIAADIVERRRRAPIETTREFADLVRRRARTRPGLDPATRAFQAVRIATNRELDGLDKALGVAVEKLEPGGRLAVISFHSLEDRIVKIALRAAVRAARAKWVIEKPRMASEDETRANPRARSARLRAVEAVSTLTAGAVEERA